MKTSSIMLLFVLITCVIPAGFAQSTNADTSPGEAITTRVNEVLCTVINVILYVSAGLTSLVLILSGVKYMTAEYPQETCGAKRRIVYAILGLIVIILACPVIDYVVANTRISPFEKT
ncbi:MAG: TrbC/VirB2 family protein [Candidatus Altiarchaeota archaeon]|nr:TrbC/VirB2 family protein [Candidatus Altiarchaeota archaeon]